MQILTINVGSSSLKSSVFLENNQRLNYRYQLDKKYFHESLEYALNQLLDETSQHKLNVVGHRFVYGGNIQEPCRLLNSAEIRRLEGLSNHAPLHMPNNLFAMKYLSSRIFTPQIACFDTSFHSTLPVLAWKLPIPDRYKMRRYGFHGLSYAHIASKLPDLMGDVAYKNVVIAHLGSGASLCLLQNLQSIDTTMGFTPAGGIPMATRSGDIDPGVILELSKSHSYNELLDLIHHGMGLIALSNGESSDMQTLLASKTEQAKFAVKYFADHVRAQIGAYAAKSGQIDAIIFTGGIGEKSAVIRSMVCELLLFMGFSVNSAANESHSQLISENTSKPIFVLGTDEEAEIARLVSSYNM